MRAKRLITTGAVIAALGFGLASTATATTQTTGAQAPTPNATIGWSIQARGSWVEANDTAYIFHLYLPSVVSPVLQIPPVLHRPYVAHVGVVTSYTGEYPSPQL